MNFWNCQTHSWNFRLFDSEIFLSDLDCLAYNKKQWEEKIKINVKNMMTIRYKMGLGRKGGNLEIKVIDKRILLGI